MKRFLFSLVVLLLVLGAGWVWLHRGTGPQKQGENTALAANQDPRALTQTEQAAFLPLVCGGASAGADGYAHDCASLPGYPSSDYGGAGTGLGITLTSIAYGNFTGPGEAYVSYLGSFEPHVTNFGGGILFHKTATGWALTAWYPGNSLDGCLVLNPKGQTPFLCVRGSTGQGETDTVLAVVTAGGKQTKVLEASDLRQTMDQNANCGLRRAADQAVLLGINGLARTGNGYVAQISYVPAATAEAACKAKTFPSAPVTKGSLPLSWNGSAVQVSSDHKFAPAA